MTCPESLVSVIIPCYQQGRFLAEAIESVLAQSHAEHEIIVVDDGSTDNTAEVAARYTELHYLRQANHGSSSARNLGIRESYGNYVVFLDADDLLLPHALKTGISALAERSDCAMTFGSCRYVDACGSALPVYRRALDRDDYYLAFLRRCYVGHPAAAMFRRCIFDAGAVFDESLPVCSDYDFYLQVARKWPVYCHNQTVSEYRQHTEQKSSNRRRMVDQVVKVLETQAPFTQGNPAYERMLKKGIRIVRHGYSRELLTRTWKNFRSAHWQDSQRDFVDFLTFEPPLAGWILAQAGIKPWLRRLRAIRKPNRVSGHRTSYII
jgi:glycosyltransferase involved in cell wall biosynthesis